MLDTLTPYFMAYSKAVASNPILAGFALWLTAALSYLARNVPKTLWNWFSTSVTTTIEMNNTGWSGNEFHFTMFLTWFMRSPWSKWSRRIYTGRAYDPKDNLVTVIGPGYGTHFFFFKGRFFWFTKFSIDSQGSDRQKEGIRISTLGRSHKALLDLVKEFEYQPADDEVSVYTFNHSRGWERSSTIIKRPLESLCLDDEVMANLLKHHDHFVNKKQWYIDRGLAYKITTLLYGPPGTGKTSIVKVLASYYNRNICIIDLSDMSNKTLQIALASLPPRSIVLMEDVDAASKAVDTRDKKDEQDKTSVLDAIQNSLNLAGLLNALDGIIPMHDVMLFMTTNKKEKLDPALVRKSRVDHSYEIGPMRDEEIHRYIARMYPNARLHPSTVFMPTIGADVQAAFKENPESLDGFLREMRYVEALVA